MLALLLAPLSFATDPVPLPAPEAAPAEVAAAVDAPHVPTEAETAATHDALRGLAATLQGAMNKGDIDTIVANVDPNVVFTTMNGDVVRGRDGVKAYFAKMMTGPDKVVENIDAKFDVDELTWLVAPDVGVAWGSSKGHYKLANGGEFDVTARWTATLLHREGKWVVGAFHYSTNMFDNPVLDALQSFAMKAGAGVGVVGLLVGAGAGWALGRRRAA